VVNTARLAGHAARQKAKLSLKPAWYRSQVPELVHSPSQSSPVAEEKVVFTWQFGLAPVQDQLAERTRAVISFRYV